MGVKVIILSIISLYQGEDKIMYKTLDEEYTNLHKRNTQKLHEKRKNPNVKWSVQILNAELRRGAGTQTIMPHQMNDEHNYKKMLMLYQETKKRYPTSSVWLVGITKNWKQKNILFREGSD